MDEGAPIATLITGRFEHTLDDKNRVTLPARYRRAFEDAVMYLVPPAHGEPCLRLYDLRSWLRYDKRYLEELDEYNDPVESAKVGDLYADIDDLKIDGAGRVMLPSHRIEQLGLRDKVLLVGHRDHFEIWEPETYAAYRAGSITRGV